MRMIFDNDQIFLRRLGFLNAYDPMSENLRFKVVMIGDSGVGKTALATRMSQNLFVPNHVPTVGSQFVTLEVQVEGRVCILDLWDTAGQEVYRSLVGYYTRGARGAFLVCDLTTQKSFAGLGEWLTFLRSEAPDIQIVLFANKLDLANERVLTAQQLELFAADHDVKLFEGSAKTGKGVSPCFEMMGELLLSSLAAVDSEPVKGVQLDAKDTKRGCC